MFFTLHCWSDMFARLSQNYLVTFFSLQFTAKKTPKTYTHTQTSNIPKQNSKLRSFKAQTLIFMLAVQPSLLSFNATAFILPVLCIMVLEARHQERYSSKEPLQTKLLYEHIYGGRKKSERLLWSTQITLKSPHQSDCNQCNCNSAVSWIQLRMCWKSSVTQCRSAQFSFVQFLYICLCMLKV